MALTYTSEHMHYKHRTHAYENLPMSPTREFVPLMPPEHLSNQTNMAWWCNEHDYRGIPDQPCDTILAQTECITLRDWYCCMKRDA